MPNDRTPDPGLDLRPLDVEPSDAAHARFVASVMRSIGDTPAAVARPDLLWGIWSMSRGLSAAAVVVALVLASLYVWERRAAAGGPVTVADALGVPPEFVAAGGGR